MITKLVANDNVLKYSIKSILRSLYLMRFKKYSMQDFMSLDAKLYKDRQGTVLDWDNLETYSEKMQWAKLFDADNRKIDLTDKYRVRLWVKETIGEEYLIPLLGVWNEASQIDFNNLPNQFVLKTNCSSGDTIIVKDKSSLTARQIKGYIKKLDYFLNMKFGYNTCELHYNKIDPKVLAEAYIDSGNVDLEDYKFLCFDGKAYYCWVDTQRFHGHKRNIYNLDWQLQEWRQSEYEVATDPIEKPSNFSEMIRLAETLSSGFPHVRVDLYNVAGKIYFGEMTFTNSSGFEKIQPKSADYMLGHLWNVDTNIRNKALL